MDVGRGIRLRKEGRVGFGHGFGFRRIGDACFVVSVNRGMSAEDEAGDIGEDSGAARRDAVLGEELVEGGEGEVDSLGGLEILRLLEKDG